MTGSGDLLPPEAPLHRRLRLRARLRWHRMGAVFRDWRYPASLAAALVGSAVIVLSVGLVFVLQGVLDRLDHRAQYSECVDDREVRWESAIGAVLDYLLDPEDPDPEQLDTLRLRLHNATVALEAIDQSLAEGGCPGQVREIP